MIFDGCDPDEVLFRQEIYRVDADQRMLRIYLPFAIREELILEQDRGDLCGRAERTQEIPCPRAVYRGRDRRSGI